MSDFFSASPAARPFKTGSISRSFLVAMLGGAVVLAGGYAVLSKGSSASGVQGSAFNPAPADAPQQKIEIAPQAAKPAVTVKSGGTKTAPATPAKTVARPALALKSGTVTKPHIVKATLSPVKVAAKPKTPVVVAKKVTRLAAAPVASRAAETTGNDWPEYMGKGRNGISRETGWFNGAEAKTVWQANIGSGFSSMAIAQGRLYAMGNAGNQDTVWCFNAADGKGLWKYSYPCELMAIQHEGGPSATPTVEGGLVFTYSKRGHLHALDAATGKVIWRHDIPGEYGGRIPQWGITSAPVVSGGTLFVMAGAPGACIMAFDKSTGAVQWKAGNDGPAYAALQVLRWKDAPYLAAFNAGGVVFYALADGKELWRYNWKTPYDVNAAMPIIAGDKVFISTGYNTGCALVQSSNNTELWKNKNMKNHFSASVLVGGAIYGFDESQLACLDGNTGKTLWTADRLGKGSLIASDGKLIILSERGELVIAEASPNAYKELSRTQILSGKCWTAPAFSNGHVYARNAAGDLVSVKF